MVRVLGNCPSTSFHVFVPSKRGVRNRRATSARLIARTSTSTRISRASDVNGYLQPTAEKLGDKLTFLEQNSQVGRTLVIG